MPGSAALNSGGAAGVNSISCVAAGACAAGGGYKDGSANQQAFVVNFTPPCIVPRVVGKTLSAAKRTPQGGSLQRREDHEGLLEAEEGTRRGGEAESRRASEKRGQGRAHGEQGQEELGPTIDPKIATGERYVSQQRRRYANVEYVSLARMHGVNVSRQYAEVFQVYRVVA